MDHLEEMVRQRTRELETMNLQLQQEATERDRAEQTLRRTAEELGRSNHDLEQFAYVASHDLQEPLRAVTGYVGLFQRRFPDLMDTKAREYVAVAGANVTHDPLPTLTVDRTQIVQLLQNLIANAIKFRADKPPAVHVSAERQEGHWRFAVRDNGIGIEPRYYERIFQVFQRLHTRQEHPGTGIGLAICKRIVERHGGTIWVESQADQGSTFYFTIPVQETQHANPG